MDENTRSLRQCTLTIRIHTHLVIQADRDVSLKKGVQEEKKREERLGSDFSMFFYIFTLCTESLVCSVREGGKEEERSEIKSKI